MRGAAGGGGARLAEAEVHFAEELCCFLELSLVSEHCRDEHVVVMTGLLTLSFDPRHQIDVPHVLQTYECLERERIQGSSES